MTIKKFAQGLLAYSVGVAMTYWALIVNIDSLPM
jgi:hypothetical protein